MKAGRYGSALRFETFETSHDSCDALMFLSSDPKIIPGTAIQSDHALM